MKFRLPALLPEPAPVVEEEEKRSPDSIKDDGKETGSEKDGKVDTSEFQYGVQIVQATNQIWTKNHLILAYIL
jgi:hypothetical protein